MSIPSITCPKTTCLLFKKGVAVVVMKNWQPLVFGPEFCQLFLVLEIVEGYAGARIHVELTAILRRPSRSWVKEKFSSANLVVP